MTNIFEVLELICLFLNVSSLVVIGIGWLTCADYYYKMCEVADGVPLFVHSLLSSAFSIATVVVGLTINGIGKPPYANLAYWICLLTCIIGIFVCNKILLLREYFANKRGRT